LYSSLFFNETVQLVNPLQGSVTVESTFQVLFAVGVVGLIVMVLAGERVMAFVNPETGSKGAPATEQGFGQNVKVQEGARGRQADAGKVAGTAVKRKSRGSKGKGKKTQ